MEVAQGEIGFAQRGVGPDQGQQGAGDEDHATDGLLAQNISDAHGLPVARARKQVLAGTRRRSLAHAFNSLTSLNEYLSPTRLPGTPAFNPSANRASDHKSPDALREIARPGINSERNYISASLLRQPGINLIGLQLQCLAQVRLGSRSQLAANERNRRGDLRVDGE